MGGFTPEEDVGWLTITRLNIGILCAIVLLYAGAHYRPIKTRITRALTQKRYIVFVSARAWARWAGTGAKMRPKHTTMINANPPHGVHVRPDCAANWTTWGQTTM